MFSIAVLFLSVSPILIVLADQSICPLPSLLFSSHACSSPPEPYMVEPSPGKGLGVFASHSLETGSIIMRERPILKISPPDFVKGSGYPISKVTKLVREEYEDLSLNEQEEVMSLTYHALPEELEQQDNDVLGYIFKNNAYNTGSNIGLFPKIARINHSCRPNAGYYWSEKLNKRIVYATRDIHEGEEIFVSFIPLLLSHEERQRKLDRYGFTCTCTACSQSHTDLSVSDQRRMDISSAFKAFESQLNLTFPSTSSSLRKARKNAASSLELAELVEQEGLADYYAAAYKIVAISHARVQDWEKATVWANEGYKRRVMEDPESGFTMEMYEMTSRFIKSWEKELDETPRSE